MQYFDALLELLGLLLGVGLIGYGAWLAYPPAGFMISGLLVLVSMALHARGRTGG